MSFAARIPFRRIARLLALIAIGYCVLLAMLWFREKSMVYVPSNPAYADWKRGERAGFEDVTFAASDGVRLHGWFKDHPQRRAVVLFLHGNGGHVPLWSESVEKLIEEQRVAAFVFDYRGYGKSAGSPDEAGLYADAQAARTWLAARTNVAESEIVLVGRSLGTGVAVHEAVRVAPRAMILISPLTSLPDAAAYHYPWVPVRWLMSQRFDSLAKIGDYRGPLLIAHGDADGTVPFSLGKRLFEAAPSSEKMFLRLPGGGHNDALPAAFDEAVDTFLRNLP
ncbi:MAG: alpha/beta hydrolase [Pirellulales bacterium]